MKSAESINIETPKAADLNGIYGLISNIKGVTIGKTKNRILMSLVERVDVHGNPDVLTVVEFYPQSIAINYSVVDEPPSFRTWAVFRKMLPVIELVALEYGLKLSDVFPILDKTVKEIDVELGKEAKQYFIEVDRLKKENSELKRKLMLRKNENEKLTAQIFDLTSKINELNVKLSKYKTMNDDILKSKIINWIKEHQGEIDITEFSKVFNVKEQVVEEKLNELIRSGNITSL